MIFTDMMQQITSMKITFGCIIDSVDPIGYPNLHLILHNRITICFFNLTRYTSFRTVYLLSFLSWQSNLLSSWNTIICVILQSSPVETVLLLLLPSSFSGHLLSSLEGLELIKLASLILREEKDNL